MLKKLLKAYSRDNTTIANTLKLIPASLKEIRDIKKRGNTLGFRKENGLWYADLKHWPLDVAHLLMVRGADTMLDELSNYSNYVTLKLSQHKTITDILPGEALLELTSKDSGGLSGTYKVLNNYKTKTVWLCPVVNFVFNKVPNYIKFSVVENNHLSKEEQEAIDFNKAMHEHMHKRTASILVNQLFSKN